MEYKVGLLTAYECAPIVSKQHLAPGITVSRRIPLHAVESHANGEGVDFEKSFPSDGRYRIVIFAGIISRPEQLRRAEHMNQVLKLSDAFAKRFDGRATTAGFSNWIVTRRAISRSVRHGITLVKRPVRHFYRTRSHTHVGWGFPE
jgi:phenol 2-monooxygenase